jgi:hypothetical protein
MHQRPWASATLLSALATFVTIACSSQDSGGGAAQGSNAGSANGSAGSATAGNAGAPGSAGSSAPGSAGSSAPGGASGSAATYGGASGTGTAAGGDAQAGTAQGGTLQGGSAAGGTASSGNGGAATGGTAQGGAGAGGRNQGGTGNGGTAQGGAGAGGGGSGPPTAQQLLGKLGSCTKVKGPFNPDGPNTGSIDVCKTGNALWWKADLDVDCDGIQTPPCNTDVTGQPQTSIVDLAPNGDVDPTKLPYFVIPLGTPESEWYTAYGVELGQIGAVIYKNQVIYGIFADQAGGNFIGEGSYKMCSLFIGANNCDPNNGGIDPLDVTYVAFTGTTPRASGQDIYNHDKHTALGEAAAKTWLGQ